MYAHTAERGAAWWPSALPCALWGAAPASLKRDPHGPSLSSPYVCPSLLTLLIQLTYISPNIGFVCFGNSDGRPRRLCTQLRLPRWACPQVPSVVFVVGDLGGLKNNPMCLWMSAMDVFWSLFAVSAMRAAAFGFVSGNLSDPDPDVVSRCGCVVGRTFCVPTRLTVGRNVKMRQGHAGTWAIWLRGIMIISSPAEICTVSLCGIHRCILGTVPRSVR